jgi:phosphoribosylaminoimidazole-succinocarboxamide synthase
MIVTETNFEQARLFRKGKVRDVYDLGDKLLLVATDRISAYDVVIPTPIPDKGRILTQLSLFWFEYTKDIVENHFLSGNVSDLPQQFRRYAAELEGRMMLTRKCQVVPFECVVRGYLVGSGWSEYKKTGTVCGIKLPQGLKEASKLPEPIFTPATKADVGHDENVSWDYMADKLGAELAGRLRDLSIGIYSAARDYAITKGVIIADTKFEFGLLDGRIILIDEVLTPDSSRFWPADKYREGTAPVSFDKQFVRDYLSSLDWDKTPPAPELPEEIVRKTREKYTEILNILTGKTI